MKKPERSGLILGVATIIAIALIWLLPPAGFVLSCLLLIVLPPWGRTLSERAVITALVLLGAIALVFPRAGSTPITTVSVHIALTSALVLMWVLRSLPIMQVSVPRPRVTDGLLAIFAIGTSWWLMSAYVGQASTARSAGFSSVAGTMRGILSPLLIPMR